MRRISPMMWVMCMLAPGGAFSQPDTIHISVRQAEQQFLRGLPERRSEHLQELRTGVDDRHFRLLRRTIAGIIRPTIGVVVVAPDQTFDEIGYFSRRLYSRCSPTDYSE